MITAPVMKELNVPVLSSVSFSNSSLSRKFLIALSASLCLHSKLLEILFVSGAPVKYDTLSLGLSIPFCVYKL